MRIYADILGEELRKKFYMAYFLLGNEPLLLDESRQTIELVSKKKGFEEIQRYSVESPFNWDKFSDYFQTISLFSERKIVEFFFTDSTWNLQSLRKFTKLVESSLHPDTLLVVQGPRLSKNQENDKWLKSVINRHCVVDCLTPSNQRLPHFIQNRCKKAGLRPDEKSVRMLAQWHEGNLSVLNRSLDRLAIQFPDGKINPQKLEETLKNQSRFTKFHWVDAALSGDSNRAQHILKYLESSGIDPISLLSLVQKELILLWQMKVLQSSYSLREVYERFRIWHSRKELYSLALNRLNLVRLRLLLRQLTQVEIETKGGFLRDIWSVLRGVSINLSEEKVNIGRSVLFS